MQDELGPPVLGGADELSLWLKEEGVCLTNESSTPGPEALLRPDQLVWLEHGCLRQAEKGTSLRRGHECVHQATSLREEFAT